MRYQPSSCSARSSSNAAVTTSRTTRSTPPRGRRASHVACVDGSAARGLLPPHLSAAALGGTRRFASDLARADVVVATTTGTAMALAAWRGAGSCAVPLVGIVAGLVNDPWRSSRRVTTSGSLRRMHAMLYGPGELEPLLARAPDLAERVHVNTFGVDTSFWAPEEVAPRTRSWRSETTATVTGRHWSVRLRRSRPRSGYSRRIHNRRISRRT